MTPSQYKALYDKLKVTKKDGSVETVSINQYRLASVNYNEAAKNKWMEKYYSVGMTRDLTLFTTTGTVKLSADQTKKEADYRKRTGLDVTISMEKEKTDGTEATVGKKAAQWDVLAAYCFLGKGAPEHYQMVLQMADHWGLAPNGLQRYANEALGLDCNGFVGTYLWHGLRGHAWNERAHAQFQGSDTFITSFFPGPAGLVRRWEDLNPSQMYIFGRINDANQVIGGGPGGPAGHIVITEPGRQRPSTMSSGTFTSTGMWVVESTGGHNPGLWESWYTCIANDPNTRTFTLRRADMYPDVRVLRFKIAPVQA